MGSDMFGQRTGEVWCRGLGRRVRGLPEVLHEAQAVMAVSVRGTIKVPRADRSVYAPIVTSRVGNVQYSSSGQRVKRGSRTEEYSTRCHVVWKGAGWGRGNDKSS